VALIQAYIRIVDAMNEWIGKISCFLLIPLTAITAFEVIMRYVFSRPTIWAWDLNIQVFAAIVMLGGGYTLLKDAHVSMDIVVLYLDRKKKAILWILSCPFLIIAGLVLLFGGWKLAYASWTAREMMPTIWAPPYYTMKMLVPIGGLLVLMQGISSLFKNILTLTAEMKR